MPSEIKFSILTYQPSDLERLSTLTDKLIPNGQFLSYLTTMFEQLRLYRI